MSLADTSVSDDINVIPEPVCLPSIHITGTWDKFLIKWDPVTNVNYDQVFYEVKIYDFSKTDFSEPVSTMKLFCYQLSAVCSCKITTVYNGKCSIFVVHVSESDGWATCKVLESGNDSIFKIADNNQSLHLLGCITSGAGDHALTTFSAHRTHKSTCIRFIF